MCATEPRSFASTSASIERGSRNRSTNQADEQSAKRSSSVTLNVVLRLELLEHERMRQLRRPPERARRALEPPLPAVRARERVGAAPVVRRELGERAQPLALGRRAVERPGERRERPPPRPPAHVLGVEDRLHLVPERARLARAAVVGRRLAHEVEPLERPRARGVEEIAVAAHRVGALQPRAALVEQAAGVVVEERRRRAAPRQAALLEAEHEDDVEAARACAQQIDDGDAAGLVAAQRAKRLALERRRDVVARELAGELAPALELGEQAVQRLVRAQVEPRRLADRRRVEPVGVAQHPRCEHAHRVDRVVGVAQLGEGGEGAAVQLLAFLDDAVGRLHGAAAQPAFDEVDGTALDARRTASAGT